MTLFGNKSKSVATNQIQEQAAPKKLTLKDLIPDDEKMYLALQTFLLGDPKRQLPMLGNVDSLLLIGDQEKAKGEKLGARINYQTAAKIEIYNLNKEGSEKFLRLALDLTESGKPGRALLETMLANMDEVMRVSKLYYTACIHQKS